VVSPELKLFDEALKVLELLEAILVDTFPLGRRTRP
jgi:hypothetical protein